MLERQLQSTRRSTRAVTSAQPSDGYPRESYDPRIKAWAGPRLVDPIKARNARSNRLPDVCNIMRRADGKCEAATVTRLMATRTQFGQIEVQNTRKL